MELPGSDLEANNSRLELLSDDQPVQMSFGMLTKLLQMCRNDTEASDGDNSNSGNSPKAMLYIVVVLLFYAFAMVVLMVKYIKRERHEAELSYYFSEFVNRDKFHAPRYQNRQKVKAVKKTLMTGMYKPLGQYGQNVVQAFQKTTLLTLQSTPVAGASGDSCVDEQGDTAVNTTVDSTEDVIVDTVTETDMNPLTSVDAGTDILPIPNSTLGQCPSDDQSTEVAVNMDAPLANMDTSEEQSSEDSSVVPSLFKITSV